MYSNPNNALYLIGYLVISNTEVIKTAIKQDSNKYVITPCSVVDLFALSTFSKCGSVLLRMPFKYSMYNSCSLM